VCLCLCLCVCMCLFLSLCVCVCVCVYARVILCAFVSLLGVGGFVGWVWVGVRLYGCVRRAASAAEMPSATEAEALYV